jgi:hypothetical protein
MKGVYQHCSEKHLHRYLAEYDFRYSNRVALGVNDGERADLAIKGAAGQRLTCRQPTSKSFRSKALRFLRWRRKRRKTGNKRRITLK